VAILYGCNMSEVEQMGGSAPEAGREPSLAEVFAREPDRDAQEPLIDVRLEAREGDPGKVQHVHAMAAGEGGRAAAVLQQQGVELLHQDRTEEAVAELLQSVRLNPYDGRTRYELGLGLAQLGRKEEALESLRQSVKLSPRVAEHHWRLAEELRRDGLELEALDEVREALELDPAHAGAKETLKALQGARVRTVLRWVRERLT
jgi:tetratricopeptide (TPR) repeat protein